MGLRPEYQVSHEDASIEQKQKHIDNSNSHYDYSIFTRKLAHIQTKNKIEIKNKSITITFTI